jgi:hypothetical protein
MSAEPPPNQLVRQIQTETVPVVFSFDTSVDGANFELEHSLFGTMTAVGDDLTVSFPISEERAAATVGDYTYILRINPGVLGSEEIAARGHWTIEPAAPA